MNTETQFVQTSPSTVDWSPGSTSSYRAEEEEAFHAFARRQKRRLLKLREELNQCIDGVAQSFRVNPNESSRQTHLADAGSDASDRDFVLNLLAHEQVALHELNQALLRIESGTYGICEISGERIPRERLEAIPYARFTVAAQDRLERIRKARRLPNDRTIYLDEEIETARREEIGEAFG